MRAKKERRAIFHARVRLSLSLFIFVWYDDFNFQERPAPHTDLRSRHAHERTDFMQQHSIPEHHSSSEYRSSSAASHTSATKKALSIAIALVLIFVFGSCVRSDHATQTGSSAAPTPTATPEPAAELPNPVVEVDGAADFADLGFIITPHQQADSVSYSIIDNTIAQIIFTLDGDTFTYRAARTTDDISGVYETFDALPQSLELDGADVHISVRVRTIDGGEHGALADWSYDGVRYSFYTPDKSDYDALTDVLLPIVYMDLPFAACCG